MKKIIQWKKGYAGKCSAEVAFDVLQKIRKRDGAISAQAIVDDARPKSSPIHGAIFDKGQKAAAEAHYLENARKMTRSIEQIHIDASKPNQAALVVPVYSAISVDGPKEKGRQRKVYQTNEELMADPITRDEVLGNAIRDAISYRRKYAALQELSKVFSAMDDLVKNFKTG